MPDTNIKTPAIFFGPDRVAELWAAIQAALGKKADKAEMSKYPTAEAMAEAIATALTDYATTAEVNASITAALADYMTAARSATPSPRRWPASPRSASRPWTPCRRPARRA